VEIPLKHLPIRQLYASSPLLDILDQVAFVVLPVILKKIEVGVVKTAIEYDWIVVVDLPQPVELILRPLSLIRQLPTLVVKLPVAIHFVVFPLPLVVTSVLVVKPASAVPHPSTLETLVPTASLVLLDYVLFLNGVI